MKLSRLLLCVSAVFLVLAIGTGPSTVFAKKKKTQKIAVIKNRPSDQKITDFPSLNKKPAPKKVSSKKPTLPKKILKKPVIKKSTPKANIVKKSAPKKIKLKTIPLKKTIKKASSTKKK